MVKRFLPLKGEGQWNCPHTNETYHLLANELNHKLTDLNIKL